jgi:hypothetical protein
LKPWHVQWREGIGERREVGSKYPMERQFLRPHKAATHQRNRTSEWAPEREQETKEIEKIEMGNEDESERITNTSRALAMLTLTRLAYLL